MKGQENLSVPFRMERIAVVVSVAGGVFEGIKPTDGAKQVEKKPVKPLGAKNRSVREFVAGYANPETGHCAVQEKGEYERDPDLLRP